MIVRKVSFWTKEKIADALSAFAAAGWGIRFAYFYADRVIMTARRMRDNRGVMVVVTKDEILTDMNDVVRRVYVEMHGNLLFRLCALESTEEAKA